ncbi:MAG: nickel-dependent lactate racemase [candidate division WOR-3 bacterium]|jgi:nickel-dependent lactate racemase
MDLRYGKGSITIQTPPGFLGSVVPRVEMVKPASAILKDSFTNPVGKPLLRELIRKNRPADVVIVVSDRTRKIANYDAIIRFLVSELVDAGVQEQNIEFIVALGTHRPHRDEENRERYGTLVDDFRFTQHDCQRDLVSLGKISSGLDVRVNRRVQEADFVIATGRVDFHYMAGYSGGRKSILPGVAAYDTIRNNHQKLVRGGVWIGNTDGNIIAQEMAEAADLLGVDYLLNAVETPEGETAQVFCGHHVHAFQQAVEYLYTARRVRINAAAECVIISAGGYPNDKDFYHTHKSMNLAMATLKQNGSIILVGQCEEGFGNDKFMQLMLDNRIEDLLRYPEEKIDVGGHRAFLTARMLRSHRVYALTDLDPDKLRRIHFIPIESVAQGVEAAQKEHGRDMRTLVVPNGKVVLPLLNGKMKTFNDLGG